MDTDSPGRSRMRLVPAAARTRPSRGDRVRWPRVTVARARIAAGFYEREDVREKVVGAILEELTRE